MLIYYLALLYILLLGLIFYRFKTDWSKQIFLFLSFLGLFLLMAMRSETVGTDLYIYRNKFELISVAKSWRDVTSVVDNAPVYCLLNKLVSYIGNYRVFMVVIAFIILFSVAFYIYHFSENVVISTYCFVVLFFYLHTYNISRQFLAIALYLLSLCFRKERKFILCVIFFLLALGVHSTAFIVLPSLLLNRDQITSKKFAIYMLVASIGVFLYFISFDRIINLFVSIFPRYQFYLQSGRFNVLNESSGSVIFLSLFYLLVVALAVIIQSNKLSDVSLNFKDKSHLRFLIIFVLFGALMGTFGGGNEALTRVLYFYQIHIICLIPNTFSKLRRFRFYYPLYYGLMMILLVPFTIPLSRNFGGVVPYITVWQ